MIRYQQGDAVAASKLAEELSARLYRFFVLQVRNHQEAEDLVQDCWLRIHKARHTYRSGEPLLPWVYAIARRTQVDRYRKRHRIARHELPDDGAAEQIAAASSDSVEKGRLPELSELLKSLPERQRETVLLLKVAGLSLEEVARATGATVGAVKQRAHRAYATLRRLFGVEE